MIAKLPNRSQVVTITHYPSFVIDTVETPAGNVRYCRHLLATLWQPLLLRLLTLTAALTPPQVGGWVGDQLTRLPGLVVDG